MSTGKSKRKNSKATQASWSGAGFAIGFACGLLLLDSVASGVILGVGLAVAMGGASKP